MLLFKVFILPCLFSLCSSQLIDYLNPEKCCESIGECFKTRFFPLFLPRPSCPVGENAPHYELWTRSHDKFPTSFTIDSVPTGKFHEGKRFYFIAHGWTNSIKSTWVGKLKDELLKKDDVNVIMIDWKLMAGKYLYPQSVSNVRTAGAHFAKVIDVIKASRKEEIYAWCLGFSLGAHVCGQVGKRTHLDRITALDPAGPIFREYKKTDLVLNKECADFLDVIHTEPFSGFYSPLGHVDFYPNGGQSQPACYAWNPKCSHEFSYSLMISSITNQCFQTKKCESIDKIGDSCEDSDQSMGYNASPKKPGIFFLETSGTYPYCKETEEPSYFQKFKNMFTG